MRLPVCVRGSGIQGIRCRIVPGGRLCYIPGQKSATWSAIPGLLCDSIRHATYAVSGRNPLEPNPSNCVSVVRLEHDA